MPEYQFVDVETGREHTIVMPMARAVPIGETVELDGKAFKRIPSTGVGGKVYDFEARVSGVVKRWHPHAPRTDEQGRAIFHSKREEHEFAARANDDPSDPLRYTVAKSSNDRPGLEDSSLS